ncbi:efflux RND transporter periplasmic adaptor subunit [Shinella sp. JR1-6]|uniref:efflux RND transporter periplasmic adaptor subunit n=1 Tax=Shinella sp. JR1-6 TaxID=2527671 RepID=UPI00102D64C5|nr:efflux RND transporter periplasmic adaptor subunit [Shinella sp. JR1-6]TAA58491.1 efflux RND transporter periplasmic adaptor subunit [Shinella sp. JR1-6]
MNTHIDITTDHQRKRAEILKSLALDLSCEDTPPKPMLRRLILPICLLALAAGAGGLILYRMEVVRQFETARSEPEREAGDLAAVPQAGALDAEQTAIRGALPARREITGSGFVVAPNATTVFAKYEGKITRVAVVPGDHVEAGEVLVTLEDAGARFALDQANAAKAEAKLVLGARDIDLAQARARLARTEILAARNAASTQVLEEARSAAERAANAVAQAVQSVDSADLAIRIAAERVGELTVRAPLTGTVTRLDARMGDTVLARIDSVRENQSLLTITDTTSLVIDADVAETTIAALRPGLRGEAVLDGFPDHPFPVTVLRLAPVASAEKGTLTLRLTLAGPPEGIRPNMAARIRITLDETGDKTQ